MNLQDAVKKVVRSEDLSQEEAASAMKGLMTGEAEPGQIGAFLAALSMKGETVEEITGFAKTMRALATKIETTRSPLVDTCGTGGDHSGTFNISTTAAFVVAGAGVPVAKHGNRSATSKCGSADVLEALGVNIDASPEQVGNCIDEVGIGFLFARALHGAMKHVAPVRATLGFPTIFNILGPLTNPAGADGQVMGIYDPSRQTAIANVLAALGVRHAFVVSGSDGLDEITLSGPSHITEATGGVVKEYNITPEDFGMECAYKAVLKGGDAAENAAILRKVLEGETGPCRDIVLLNAAAAIVAGQKASDLAEGVEVAKTSIDSGAARATLEALIACSNNA